MDSYLYNLKTIADSLAAINSAITSTEPVICALAGLPPEYESFVTAVTSNDTILTFDALRSKLLYEEQLLQAIDGSPSTKNNTTFAARASAGNIRRRGSSRS